ncbi:uncharacterized protein LOC109711502 isoform X4 [Ananas comosus]|uniref:Uncharacterized protein LOC109711502 isoform X4 n=1 Tax=Ananas comosus TaxID=4615 RepID=A0A6P5FA53_ANACO|nr:uncharacterized protein LOC109711502 isoform X4 [Ananas comosus]
MANAEPQKQLLSLIRDFATEKSRGERRVSDLRKRLVELQYDLDSANSDLASAKRAKEMVEEELQGSQAHLAMTDASMLVIEGRIYRLQEEISKVGSDLAALKREEDVQRDDFINRMSGLNVKIRHFREMVAKESLRQPCHKIPLDNVGKLCSEDDSFDSENIIKNLEVEIKCIDAEMLRLESEYQKELHDHHEFIYRYVGSWLILKEKGSLWKLLWEKQSSFRNWQDSRIGEDICFTWGGAAQEVYMFWLWL